MIFALFLRGVVKTHSSRRQGRPRDARRRTVFATLRTKSRRACGREHCEASCQRAQLNFERPEPLMQRRLAPKRQRALSDAVLYSLLHLLAWLGRVRVPACDLSAAFGQAFFFTRTLVAHRPCLLSIRTHRTKTHVPRDRGVHDAQGWEWVFHVTKGHPFAFCFNAGSARSRRGTACVHAQHCTVAFTSGAFALRCEVFHQPNG